ncbi:DUF4236 domain-containing protein [Haemophilus haemolyticus]|uniref:DUF4236 domain-containing protein n=1 Tax=Haemophilus haemolyticus TaxID=726 RepID=A0A502LMS8_HAEHA|nr:DUF4236 domain-containing protein [Haemophilus haemolyticus]TPH22893.1 DUF4236 domain-containing protein [Haemophilus haemolyticus]
MAINFRKRVKVAPGVYINLGKKGVSTTIGAKGLSVNVGKNGANLNVGIPGTGLSSRIPIYSAASGVEMIDGVPNIPFDYLSRLYITERPNFTKQQSDILRPRFNSLTPTQKMAVLKRVKVYPDSDVGIYSGWLGWLAVDRFRAKQYGIAILKLFSMLTLFGGLLWLLFDLLYFRRQARNANFLSFMAAIDQVVEKNN